MRIFRKLQITQHSMSLRLKRALKMYAGAKIWGALNISKLYEL